VIADIGRPEDFVDGTVRIVDVGGREVGVVRWGEEFFAVRNVCPHQAGPVCAGLVRPNIVSGGRPGELAVDLAVPILACPWHGWEFDVRSGKSISGATQTVRTYAISVEGGRLTVDVPAGRR
jgi:nitrite reductase/ring-hydroxylating ferredoxin subunit